MIVKFFCVRTNLVLVSWFEKKMSQMPEDDECYKNLGRKYVWYKDFMVKKIYVRNS